MKHFVSRTTYDHVIYKLVTQTIQQTKKAMSGEHVNEQTTSVVFIKPRERLDYIQ